MSASWQVSLKVAYLICIMFTGENPPNVFAYYKALSSNIQPENSSINCQLMKEK